MYIDLIRDSSNYCVYLFAIVDIFYSLKYKMKPREYLMKFSLMRMASLSSQNFLQVIFFLAYHGLSLKVLM